MRKKHFIILVSVLLLSGCSLSDGADISVSETNEDLENLSEPENFDNDETDGAPAGVSFAEIPQQTAETDTGGSVSLIKEESDRIRDMVSFEGEFVSFEELGYEQYVLNPKTELDWFYERPNAIDNERLYFFKYGWTGEQIRLLNVYEYDVPAGTSNCIEMPADCSEIIYIDRDYILYCNFPEFYSGLLNARFYLIDRNTGETINASNIIMPFQTRLSSAFVRCGDYLFFTRYEAMTAEDGYSQTVELLMRYSLSRNELQAVELAKLLGAVGDEIVIAPFGGTLERVHYTLDSVPFYASPDELYLGGEQVGYVVPTDRSTVFGERYEAGRLFPLRGKNLRKPVFTTAYGVSVEEFLITAQSAAAVRLITTDGAYADSAEMVIADTKNKKTAVFPKYGDEVDYGFLMCDGDWIYFSYYDDHRIVALNTGN